MSHVRPPRSLLLGCLGFTMAAVLPSEAVAQAIFRDTKPLAVTITTNLRDLLRERDSTALRWFGAALSYADDGGAVRRQGRRLRHRGLRGRRQRRARLL